MKKFSPLLSYAQKKTATWPKRIILWLGLLLCAYAIWRTGSLTDNAANRISIVSWISVTLLLLINWLLAITTWRQYLLAYTNNAPDWQIATRQLGLLLVGKYIPGGIFGFLARIYDQPNSPRRQLFWAGLVEQIAGMAISATLGGVLYLSATQQNRAWMLFGILIPPLAITGAYLLHSSASQLPLLRHKNLNQAPNWRRLLLATTLQLTQSILGAALVTILAQEMFGLDINAAIGLAGAFLLAIAAGLLVILAPGGIGIREAVLIGLASQWIETSQAILLTALLRIISSIFDIFAGGIAAMIRTPQKISSN